MNLQTFFTEQDVKESFPEIFFEDSKHDSDDNLPEITF